MATDYQETTRMLGDLPWSGRHECYVVFHVKLLLCRVRSRFRALRSRGRIIWKSKVESFGYGISLGLFPPLIMVGNCAYHAGKSVLPLQSILNLFE
jgi:uncharacterized membrane protein YjgN (DUF898 family)